MKLNKAEKGINNRRQVYKQEYQAFLIQINKDNEQLSTKKEMSDIEFVQCSCKYK